MNAIRGLKNMLAVFLVLLKDGYQFLVLLINVISFFCEEKNDEIFQKKALCSFTGYA